MRATPALSAKPALATTTNGRAGPGVLYVLAALTVAAFIAYGYFAFQWRDTPFAGVMVTHQLEVTAGSPSGSGMWAGLDGGLQEGDRIIAVNDRPLESDDFSAGSYALQTLLESLEIGEQITVDFIRPAPFNAFDATGVACETPANEEVLCRTSYALSVLPDSDFLALFVTPFVSGLVVLGVALWLLRHYGSESVSAAPILTMLLLSLFMAGIFDLGSTHRLAPLWLASGVILGGMLITLGMVFPSPIPMLRARPAFRLTPLFLSTALAIYMVYLWIDGENALQIQQAAGISAIVGMAILATLLFFYHRPRAQSRLGRDQANTVFLGVALALIPAAVWVLGQIIVNSDGDPLVPFSVEAAMPFYVTPAISITYAVLQYRRLDTDRLVSQAFTYGLMLLAVIIGYTLLVTGASLFTTETVDTDNPLLIAITVFAISALFVPLRSRLRDQIDTIFYRKRRNFEALEDAFNQRLTTLDDAGSMITEFREALNEAVQPSGSLVFLQDVATGDYVAFGDPIPESDVTFEGDSGLINILRDTASLTLDPNGVVPAQLHADRVRLGIINAAVIYGLSGADGLKGFVSVSPPSTKRRTQYGYEELQFIENTSQQLAVAVGRAQVIGSLQRRVSELDVLSQVGQAVNFTIELDDLLELISAQTLRLFDSPFFYITLYEEAGNQLYYALFLEDDDRDVAKENKKWPLGRDLFSEIIESAQAVRVDDYAQTMADKHYEIVYENPNMAAWMGVPLIAGARTLGVLSIGEIDTEKKYTEEQLRIFSNLGALAATSIEKARLFTEANIRARQLTVLNDISRDLVEAEGDIESLLQQITSSAVEILNAEAGSLLLTSADGTELEFKTAVGGTGHELIGTTLPAGHGLVGRVANSGEPVIVNDTSQDERWQGEVAEDGAFHTRSVLAVPLIAKDEVIGVLEVINKQDGTPFVGGDTELLTSFAGQAAIAFENARLFQQTDEQLSRRVSELESLEKIDVELNQTLDLNTVAEITVRWALTNSNATAGALGIVNEEQSQMRIICMQGYEDADLSTYIDDDIWSLDSGIVKRVMRTRQPDLQPDVSIDPDYEPSLKDALSQITVPMTSGEDVNAILVLETATEPRLNLLDQDWAQRLAEHASIAIANAQLYSELLRANESKSEFVGFAAHELKNPLASVKGYADLLKSGMPGDLSDQQTEFLTIIRSNANRMQTIIDDLRDIAKIDAQQLTVTPSPIDFRNVIVETLRPFQQNLDDKGQTLENNLPEDLPRVLGDQMRLIQVVTNLISNAHKYSPEGSVIKIDAQVLDNFRDEKGAQLGPVLQTTIADNGIGMTEEDQQKLFKVRYFRSSNKKALDQPGTGLGMMITRNIIEQHGGAIWVESVYGEGTSFHFVIPLAEQKSLTTEPASD